MINKKEIEVLRTLAGRVREIAELPAMKKRKERWYKHNSLISQGPMILCFPEGAWEEIIGDSQLKCNHPTLRNWEMELSRKIYWWENINDDNAIEPFFNINWEVNIGNYGFSEVRTQNSDRGSYHIDFPIKDMGKDIEKLHFRQIKVDKKATMDKINLADSIFGDILPIRIRGQFWWTMGLTWEAIKLIGLENMMLYMYDEPENLHRLMDFLSKEHMNFLDYFETEGLLTLSNEDDYVGSGGVGYTKELPSQKYNKNSRVSYKDIWGFGESQETVGVSPEMFNEFVLPYQKPILDRFGLVSYGCCEPIHERWDYLKNIPNLRRLSISPWCNQNIMAEKLGSNYIFSRKPNPTIVCTAFDEYEIRKDLRNTIKIAGNGVLEIILKDTHTVENQPNRLKRWVEIAKEESNR